MRIAIDMLLAEREQGGMFFAACALLEGLACIDSDNEYVIISACPEAYASLQAVSRAPNMRLHCIQLPFKRGLLVQHQMHVTRALLRIRPDVLHVPAFAAPLGWRGPLVQTVHDFAFLKMPQQSSLYAHLYWRYCLRASVGRARRIIVVSEQTRADLQAYWPVKPERVHLIHNALRSSLQAEVAPREVGMLRQRIGGPYLLHVGRIMPRKNVETLVQAFDLLAHRYPDLRLVLAGGTGYGSENVIQHIHLSPYRDRIYLPGRVAEEEMGSLYVGASIVVFPSLHEGFGLPSLEAMACGTPVIANLAAASREIVGEAVLRVDCASAPPLARAISCLLDGVSLRERLVKMGRGQARLFSGTGCAQQTLRVYALAAADI